MTRKWSLFAIVGLVVSNISPATATAEQATGVHRVLIICGLPGDEAHHTLFAETIERLQHGFVENLNVSPDQILVQFGDAANPEDPAIIASASGRSTREELTAEVRQLEQLLQPDDTLWVIVMGHAYFDGKNAFLNLPGPDLRADEFGQLCQPLHCREQVFFITCPISGYFIKHLSSPQRVVISATEADLEVNETDCAIALSEVLAGPPYRAAFDVDEDGRLTIFDLYIVLVRRVIERYTTAMAVVTEHALLEDNGDGRGSEVQIDYLTEEQGGRWKPGNPIVRPKKDGNLANRWLLPIQVPEQPPQSPDDPADALSPENNSEEIGQAAMPLKLTVMVSVLDD